MKFVIDENLPPRLALWLRERGHDAVHCRSVLGDDRSDGALALYAVAEARIIVTKDTDFDPPRGNERVVRLRIGNGSNVELFDWLEARLDAAIARLKRSEIYVEVD